MTEKEINEESGMQLHHCKGYLDEIESLPICRETMERAKKCGFNILEFAESCLNVINQNVTSNENTYENIAKVVESFVNATMPFLEKYRVKDIEVGRFQIRYTNAEAVVYLSQMHQGFIVVEIDENGEHSVRTTDTEEIWRYLDEPRHMIQAVVSKIVNDDDARIKEIEQTISELRKQALSGTMAENQQNQNNQLTQPAATTPNVHNFEFYIPWEQHRQYVEGIYRSGRPDRYILISNQ